ncbi:MAG: hypothetical protein IPG68_00040 [Micrococcales bacterium]|nr:hypothetical protein [Micrococcales bacterium]
MSDYEYNGPRVPRTPVNEAKVRHRFHKEVESIVAYRFDEAMKAWAVSNEGRFPNRDQITRDINAELETLCRALDGWGAVPPDTILGPDWKYELGDLFG